MPVQNKILEKMLERLYASLANGPVMNCRPHSSRQRIDLETVAQFGDSHATEVLRALLDQRREIRLSSALHASSSPGTSLPVTSRASASKAAGAKAAEDSILSVEEREQKKRESDEILVLSKLRSIVEDARTYEQDTGAQVLYVGYPLLNIPPNLSRVGAGRGSKSSNGFSKRILAPLCFIPVEIAIKNTRPPSITLKAQHDGSEHVVPNATLLSWLEQTTGVALSDLFEDESEIGAFEEIERITSRACKALGLPIPESSETRPVNFELVAIPKNEDEEAQSPSILQAAVLGLFPVSNQGLLRDLQALIDEGIPEGPIESFLQARSSLGLATEHGSSARLALDKEFLITHADPCQARAVRLASQAKGLVVHGPPGTGKSQTIANIVGDHLARGERVLFVCEKRTALDVVHHRLSHLGLGDLCAIIHDAQKDQKNLYKSLREQLEALSETKTNAGAQAQLSNINRELIAVHAELHRFDQALSARNENMGEQSFQEIAGEWLGIQTSPSLQKIESLRTIRGHSPKDFPTWERTAREVLERARTESAFSNPWCEALGIDLATYLANDAKKWRDEVDALKLAAPILDATQSQNPIAYQSLFALDEQKSLRAQVCKDLEEAFQILPPDLIVSLASRTRAQLETAATELQSALPHLARLERAKSDRELQLVTRSQAPSATELVIWISSLTSYLEIAKKWYRFFFFARNKEARPVLQRFGLLLAAQSAERLKEFLESSRARLLVTSALEDNVGPSILRAEHINGQDDTNLAQLYRASSGLIQSLLEVDKNVQLGKVRERLQKALRDPQQHHAFLLDLKHSVVRADALQKIEELFAKTALFSNEYREATSARLRAGGAFAEEASKLADTASSIEGILRMKKALASLPPSLSDPLTDISRIEIGEGEGLTALRKGVLYGHLLDRMASDSTLQEIDNEGMKANHQHYRLLDWKKRQVVLEMTKHRWVENQRSRLLASTGSRMNALGAELRRRLALRGEKALRIRQVIAAGNTMDGGDPIFDLRPVWMVSPETAAQIFPRTPLFDVVIFDEASQCRLEEALPVLLRAKRVVIAGDPKQLPPTRFFESAVVRSETDTDDLTEQGLFEEQQADTEDLLGSALNLEIEQCYLDVHYRSNNSDLIEFSNRNFYESRLQAIPGHPKNRVRIPPLRITPVAGIYDKRANIPEAEAVVGVVRELLALEKAPSIGIACFNLTQRDAIVFALDQAALNDAVFAGQLAAARTRSGAASFEGLFVKNLENVQGDERDHIIISTTYGPDTHGKFYRRFGPLAQSGGGRRLNVLVTRARQAVHLVTSIPASVYRALPPLEPNQSPNGAWLLFSYLQYAEQLEVIYAKRWKGQDIRKNDDELDGTNASSIEYFTQDPSPLVQSLSARIEADLHTPNARYWGNDGFCVDLALLHPERDGEVTIGILCDGTRYDKAEDKIEWDLFRTSILEGQGWRLHRTWSPTWVRNAESNLANIQKEIDAALLEEKNRTPGVLAAAEDANTLSKRLDDPSQEGDAFLN